MTFLHAGLFAAGVAAIAIPILIHLLMRRRRKPVPWGAMRFLLEAYRRTRRRLLVQRWLLLAARCLLLAMLAVALGRPLLGVGSASSGGGRVVHLLIDNSLASRATDDQGRTALSRHVEAARAALDQLGDGDRAGLMLMGTPVDRIVLPPTGNLPAVRALLAEIVSTDSAADIPGALAAVQSSLADGGAAGPEGIRAVGPSQLSFVLLISDFVRGSASLDASLPRLPPGVRLVASRPPVAGIPDRPNVTIQSVDPLRATILSDQLDQSQTAVVRVVRSGPSGFPAAVSRVLVRAESVEARSGAGGVIPLGESTIEWSRGQSEANVTIALDTAALNRAWSPSDANPLGANPDARPAPAVLLSTRIDDDRLIGDNLVRTPVQIRDTLRVGFLGSAQRVSRFSNPESLTADQWMRLALRPREDSAIEIIDLDPAALDASRLSGLDAIIITAPERLSQTDWPRLRQAVERTRGSAVGGTAPGLLIVMPPGHVAVHTWTDAMTQGLGLDWTIAREARAVDQGGPTSGLVVGSTTGRASLLAPLRAELSELARSVSVSRVLPVAPVPRGASIELALGDGTGFVLTTPLFGRRRPAPEAPPGDDASPVGTRSAGNDEPSGMLVYIAGALELKWTDLPVKPLMVPLVQELVRQGVGRSEAIVTALAGQPLVAPAQSVLLRPRVDQQPEGPAGAAGAAEAIITLDQWGAPTRSIRDAGVWEAFDSFGSRRGVVVVNADASGGDLTPLEPAAVEAWLGTAATGGPVAWVDSGSAPGDRATMSAAFTSEESGRPASPSILLSVLLLALVEMALARSASHAST
ncbi:MAG: BatA domain-containing protein [Phycisphaerales bacterium]